MLSGDTFWAAVALVLVIEGLMPFLSPAAWKRTFAQIIQLSDGQVRFFGLFSVLFGFLLLWLLGD